MSKTAIGILIITIIIGAYGLLMLRGHLYWKRMRAGRSDINFEAFKRAFENSEYEPAAVESAWHDLTESRCVAILPKDDLEKTLGFLWEDFDTMLEQRCKKWGIAMGKELEQRFAPLLPVRTVEDYVRLLSAMMMKGANGRIQPDHEA